MDTDQESRLWEVLERWEGTPYLAGHRVFRQGVDCVQFIAAVLGELYHKEVHIPRLAATCAVHDRELAYCTIKALITGFPCDKVVDIEPGDVIVSHCGNTSAGTPNPHHCLIVSPDPNVLFHSMERQGVCRTPTSCWQAVLIYRPRGEYKWPDYQHSR